MSNPVMHIALNTADVDKARLFYGKHFRWKLSDAPPTREYDLRAAARER
jgi:predicted enzyme related to lactoylglutathione lyase